MISQFLFNFDAQMLSAWSNAGKEKLLPYRDLFYPYGLFSYFKSNSELLNFFGLMLLVIIFAAIYKLIFSKFEDKRISYVGFIIFIAFVLLHTTIDVFLRYSPVVVFALFSGRVIYTKKKEKLQNISLGILSGLVFVLFPDQGIYAFTCYISLLFLVPITTGTFVINTPFLKGMLIQLSRFMLGLGIVLGFFALILQSIGILDSFMYAFVEIKQIALFAKIPFPPSLYSLENILTIFVLIFSVSLISYSFFVIKTKILPSHIALLTLIVPLILLEQKNVLRSIDSQISFIAFLLLFASLLIAELGKKISNVIIILLATLLFVASLFWHYDFNTNKSNQESELIGAYKKVLTSLEKNDAKVFSFPSDPLIYSANNQKPPYFLSIYEASFKSGQEKRIEYLKKNNVDYVIIDTDNYSVQDSVPNSIRGRYELSYILNNFIPEKYIGKYLVLKSRGDNPIISIGDSRYKKYRKFLLDIDLGLIPYAEARDKKHYLGKKLTNGSNLQELKLPSANKFILLKAMNDDKFTVAIRAGEVTTNVSISKCLNYCLINLESLPLFYSSKVIDSVTSNEKLVDLGIFESGNSVFW